MPATLETNNGHLHRATIPGTSSANFDDDQVLLEAVTNASGEIVAVLVSGDCVVELHEVPRLIHALQCALTPYGAPDPAIGDRP